MIYALLAVLFIVVLVLALIVFHPQSAQRQITPLRARVRSLEKRVAELDGRIRLPVDEHEDEDDPEDRAKLLGPEPPRTRDPKETDQ